MISICGLVYEDPVIGGKYWNKRNRVFVHKWQVLFLNSLQHFPFVVIQDLNLLKFEPFLLPLPGFQRVGDPVIYLGLKGDIINDNLDLPVPMRAQQSFA